MLTQCDIPCFKCEKPLNNLDPDGNQPFDGLEFVSHTHYGSVYDGSGDLVINVCDECMQ